MLIRTGEKTPDRRWLQNPVSNPLWAACTLVTENARRGVEGGGGWWVGGGCTSAAPECQGARIILRREARLRCIFTRRPCNCSTVGASREAHRKGNGWRGGGGLRDAGVDSVDLGGEGAQLDLVGVGDVSRVALLPRLRAKGAVVLGRWCWAVCVGRGGAPCATSCSLGTRGEGGAAPAARRRRCRCRRAGQRCTARRAAAGR